MRRLASALTTTAVALGLLGLSPMSASAAACPDPDHPFTAQPLASTDLALGIAGAQGLRFTVEGSVACPHDDPYVWLTSPRQQILVHLWEQDDYAPGRYTRSGVYEFDPVLLRNPDAGTWHVAYDLDGTTYAEATFQVRRATRLTLDAGRLRHHKITFQGRLERADWEWRAYRAYGRHKVVVSALGTDDRSTTVARTTTTKHGRYHVRGRVPGPGAYRADYAGGRTAAPGTSATETVGSVR